MSTKCLPPTWMCLSRGNSRLRQIAPQGFAVLILTLFSVSCGSVSASNPNPQNANAHIAVSAKLPAATIGAAYNASISVSGGKAPYTFSVSSGTLPPGLSLSPATGLIAGTPTSSGSFSFSVSASDASSQARGNALVTLPVQSVAFTVSPATASAPSLGIQQFQAAFNGETVSNVTWSATQGAISTSGIFTAPSVKTDTQVIVTASHTIYRGTLKRTLTANAVVTVTAVGGGIVSVSISPSAQTLTSSGTQQFTATVSNSSNSAVTWSASLGTISTNGLFTAPRVKANTTGTVTATSVADRTKWASASVTVIPAGVPPPQ